MSESHNNRQRRIRSDAATPEPRPNEGRSEKITPHKVRLNPRPGSPREQWEQRRLSQRIGYRPEDEGKRPSQEFLLNQEKQSLPNSQAPFDKRPIAGRRPSQQFDAPTPSKPSSSTPFLTPAQRVQRATAGGGKPAIPGMKTTAEIGQENLLIQAQAPGVSNPHLAKGKAGMPKPAPTPKVPLKLSPLLLIVAAVLVVGLAIFVGLGSKSFTVTVNGVEVPLRGDHTLTSLVKDGYAHPQPGSMLAVDGLPIEGHEGLPFSAVVNGKTVENLDQKVRGGQIIIISDGGDKFEPYDESLETVPFAITEEGDGPLHRFEGQGSDGLSTVRVGSVSGITIRLEEAPVTGVTCRRSFPNGGGEKVIALTFEGGPSPENTGKILDILATYNLKATFFIEGDSFLKDQEALIKRISDSGHQLAVKISDEPIPDIDSLSADDQRAALMKGYDALCRISGKELSRVFRGGNGGDPHSVRHMASYMSAAVNWTLDTKDTTATSKNALVLSIEAADSGSILLLHDGGANLTFEALEVALPFLKEKGFRFLTADELLALG